MDVDLVPLKTCTYDCVYCQLGCTTRKTITRREYTPINGILAELKKKLKVNATADYASLAGPGEPTLHARIGEVITGLKHLTCIPVAVRTNGSLLWRRDVQDALMEADLVLSSLDAGDAALFRQVNRPHSTINFETMVEGLRTFRERFRKPLWLEVFLLTGVTGIPAEVEKIAAFARRIHPARVRLNTVSRPPCEACALRVPVDRLAAYAALFQPAAEVISDGRVAEARTQPGSVVIDAALLALLRRRPWTARGIASHLGLHVAEVTKRLHVLTGAGTVASLRQAGVLLYTAADTTPHNRSSGVGTGRGRA